MAIGALAVILVYSGPLAADPPGADRQYPPGAGPDHIDFSALNADDENVSQTPREYWDSYAIISTEPPNRSRVEGDYYINATTGEVISDLWDGAMDYRNGTTYAYVQPADRIPNEHQREQFEADPSFVYDNATDAYYRYDPHYGQIAPTNIGRHTDLLEFYTWEAVNTTTHHGVPVLTYRVTGKRSTNSGVPPALRGTLELGVEDGIVYAYDITVADDGEPDRYTYEVRPAAFPDHDWVDRARRLAAEDAP